MPRDKKVEMPAGQRYNKNMLRIIYRRMGAGVWENFTKLREKLRFSGMSTNQAWVDAIVQMPFDETERRKYFQEVRDKLPKRPSGYKRVIKLTVAVLTGIPLIDWVYANMGTPNGKESEHPQCHGDREFLLWARANPRDFYNGFFKPALLKKFKITDDEAPPPAAPMPSAEMSMADLLTALDEPVKAATKELT